MAEKKEENISPIIKNNTTLSKINVFFIKIEDSYPIDLDICVNFSVSKDLIITPKDWIGLYKVGWMSTGDYIHYVWSPLPPGYTNNTSLDNTAVFPASKLPKSEGDFYQFCYVTSEGEVRGASTPFQFHKEHIDQLVEEEDGDIMIIKKNSNPSSDDFQRISHRLQTVELTLESKLNDNMKLQKDLDKKIWQFKMSQNELMKVQNEAEKLAKDLKECCEEKSNLEEILEKEKENKKINEEKKEKIKEELEKQKKESEKKLKDLNEKNEEYLKKKEEEFQSLQKNYDEKLNYIENLSKSEIIKKTNEYGDDLKKLEESHMEEKEILKKKYQRDKISLETELINSKHNFSELNKLHENSINDITNLEDKFLASENSKKVLKAELSQSNKQNEENSKEIKKLKEELELRMKELNSLIKQHHQEKNFLEEENKIMKKGCEHNLLKIDGLNEELQKINQTKEQINKEISPSFFALITAHKSLTKKYNDIKTKNNNLIKALLENKERMKVCKNAYLEQCYKHENLKKIYLIDNKLIPKSFEEDLKLFNVSDDRILVKKTDEEKTILSPSNIDSNSTSTTGSSNNPTPLVSPDQPEASHNFSQPSLSSYLSLILNPAKKLNPQSNLCPFCNFEFAEGMSEADMTRHVEEHVAECSVCGLTFETYDILSLHMQNHFPINS